MITPKIPEVAIQLYQQGLAAQKRGDPARSADIFRAVVLEAPVWAEAHYNLGVALAGSGHSQASLECYLTTIRLDCHHAYAHYNLGRCLMALNDFAGAEIVLRRYTELAYSDPEGHFVLGYAHAGTGDTKAEIDCYETAIALDREYAVAHLNLGVCYHRNGRSDESRQHLATAVRCAPNSDISRMAEMILSSVGSF